MALASIVAARRQTAAQEVRKSCIEISESLGIEPPNEVSPGIKDKAMREAVHLESLAEFISRAKAAIGGLVEAATMPKVKKGSNEQSNRLDKAKAAGGS